MQYVHTGTCELLVVHTFTVLPTTHPPASFLLRVGTRVRYDADQQQMSGQQGY